MDVPVAIDCVDAGGVRTRVLLAGREGAPAVLLHGATGSLEYICANNGLLPARFRVIAVDVPGLGRPDHSMQPARDN